jgi:hypothetical protein
MKKLKISNEAIIIFSFVAVIVLLILVKFLFF